MIQELTKSQSDRFQEFVDKWTRIGFSTEPANRSEAERGIRLAYEAAGLTPPKLIVWCGSPMSQGLTRAIVFGLDKSKIEVKPGASVRASVWASVRDSVRASVGDSVRDSVRASVGDSVRDSVRASVWDSVRDSVRASVRASVWASVRDSVRASVGDSVRASVGDSVWASVGDSVWASVRASVGDSVRDSVGASVWDSVGASVWDSAYGQHDANWLGFYDFFAEVCDLGEATKKLTGMWIVAKNAGWFLPHKNICWISERHNILHRDEQGRLHCETGPALAYPDGWAIYAIHGVRVPEYVVMEPDKITVQDIESETNAEVRRVKIGQYGQSEYLLDSGAKMVHQDDFGTLYQKQIPNDEPLTMVKVINSTEEPDGTFKEYFIRVHPELRPLPTNPKWTAAQKLEFIQRQKPQKLTAHNAVASTFGMRGEDYAPYVET